MHKKVFDFGTQISTAKRSLSMPDVYHGLIRDISNSKDLENFHQICQQHGRKSETSSSNETISSGLKTNSSSSSIGSRNEGILVQAASMSNLQQPRTISKFTNNVKSKIMMGSCKR